MIEWSGYYSGDCYAIEIRDLFVFTKIKKREKNAKIWLSVVGSQALHQPSHTLRFIHSALYY